MKQMRAILKKIFLTGLMAIVCYNNSNAQAESFSARSSLGVMIGGSYYIGDLNQFGHFKNTNISGALIYRYHVNSRIAIRGALRYGKVEGYDSQSNDPYKQLRNFSFESQIFEFAAGIEFNFLNYKLGNNKYFFTPYMFLDMGIFKMNPRTNYNGEMVNLRSIGTEGQGSELSDLKRYSLIQFVIPFGIGFKINLGKRAALTVEYGIRKTFTDYLDDVGEGDFINREELILQNGNIAAELSDRSPADVNMTGKRGNPATKDWYSMFGIGVTFKLGKPNTCFY